MQKYFILFSLFLIPIVLTMPSNAAVTQIGTPAFTTNNNTLNFTVPAGSDRILLVVASDDDNVTAVASVSYGGNALVQRATHNDGFAVDSVWTLFLGTSAMPTNANIIVVGTGGTPNNLSFIAASAFSGVSQVVPVSNIQVVDNGTFPSANTLNIVSTPGNLVFDVWDVYTAALAPPNTVTPGASQTVVHNAGTVTIGAGFAYYRTSTRPGAAVVPMTWTTSNGGALIHIGMNINAAPTAASVGISGRVFTPNARGLTNAFVTMTNSSGETRSARTNQFGYYRFTDVGVGETYVFDVKSKRYQFVPQVVHISDDLTDLNFMANGFAPDVFNIEKEE